MIAARGNKKLRGKGFFSRKGGDQFGAAENFPGKSRQSFREGQYIQLLFLLILRVNIDRTQTKDSILRNVG